MGRRPSPSNVSAKDFVLAACAPFWTPATSSRKRRSNPLDADVEIASLWQKHSDGMPPKLDARRDAVRVLELLVDQHHFVTGLRPQFVVPLLLALRDLDGAPARRSPWLRPGRVELTQDGWDESRRQWARANCAGAVLLLQACCGMSAKEAAKKVAEAIEDTHYRPSRGAMTPPRREAVTKYAREPLTLGSSSSETVQQAIFGLVLHLEHTPKRGQLPMLTLEAITNGLRQIIDALSPPMPSSKTKLRTHRATRR